MVTGAAGRNRHWHEVLRRAETALRGRVVVLWESDAEGHLRAIATSKRDKPSNDISAELEGTLEQWQVPSAAGRRWLASRLDRQWCLAPVRAEVPGPPPAGVERRAPERIALELAGECLGHLMEAVDHADGDGGDRVAQDMGQTELEDFFEHASIGMHLAGPDGAILRVNQAELEMLGYERDEYLGRRVSEFHLDPAAAEEALRRVRAGETVHNLEARLRRKDGAVLTVLISSNARFQDGVFLHTRCITRDISERVAAGRQLAEYRTLVDSATDAIISKTLDGTITRWNAGAERLYGYTAAEAVGRSVAMLVPEDQPDELDGILARLRQGERIEPYETVRVRKDGARLDVSVTVSPILDDSGQPVGASVIARDITERRRTEQQLLHGAMHDPLTDLPNRTFFTERLALAMERTRRDEGYRFAVLFLDLDNFKVINDSLGHEVGDRLLTRIAARLQSLVRPGDVVARLGGDEFTMLLEDVTSPTEVERAARRIEQSLAAPFLLEGRELVVSSSVGVALSTEAADRPEDLMRDADLAMYRAKAEGKGRFVMFDTGMRERAHARFDMETDLHRAIERGELRLLYQPIVELRTGRVHAFEALLRWHHPERGVIMPLDFIPLAEETGLIVPIGSWVIREACWHARRWHYAFPEAGPMRVSVNVSPIQLSHPHLVADVKEALREEKLDPSRLRLEITESALMDDLDASAELLSRLRALGVELHMDDFGTGFSSLSYLPRLPLQTIKIDRQFTHRMGLRRTDQELVRSIVDLARNLEMGVIAEGVETVLQAERLIAFGCELGQGFHFARPLEPITAGALLEPVPA